MNEGLLAVALDAVQKEFRNLDRIEAPFREETPDCRGGLLFQIVDHAARVSVQANLTREFVSGNL